MKAEMFRGGVDCAVKIIKKSKINQHQILIDLMKGELNVLQETVSYQANKNYHDTFLDSSTHHESL